MTVEENRRCEHPSHRVIPVRFPYAEARIIRARLAEKIGEEQVSALLNTKDGWAIIICPRCGGRSDSE
jgi:hypothetical protein